MEWTGSVGQAKTSSLWLPLSEWQQFLGLKYVQHPGVMYPPWAHQNTAGNGSSSQGLLQSTVRERGDSLQHCHLALGSHQSSSRAFLRRSCRSGAEQGKPLAENLFHSSRDLIWPLPWQLSWTKPQAAFFCHLPGSILSQFSLPVPRAWAHAAAELPPPSGASPPSLPAWGLCLPLLPPSTPKLFTTPRGVQMARKGY